MLNRRPHPVDAYVVAGNPVEHSQSPFIHAMFAAATGEALTYDRLLCPLDAFATSLQRFAAGGGRGCNVTVPFKFAAFAIAAQRTPRAELAGACNTLRFGADGWLGDNTDGAGLTRDLMHNAGVSLAGRRVLLIGAGGAGAGVLGPLLDAGPTQVTVANRHVERAQALVDRHAPNRPAHRSLPDTGEAPDAASRSDPTRLMAQSLDDCGDGYDIVINATSSSLAGAASPVHQRVLKPGALAVDLMYGPAAEPFLHWAGQHGATPRDGLGMLVEQAAESFFLFRGRRPDTAPVLAALRARLGTPAR